VIIALSVIFFFIILRFVVTLFNFISDPKLRKIARRYDDLVSILIPARNEEANIISLLQSINAQDYKNYEVVVLDDDSDDQTYQLCAAYAASHAKFKVIKGDALPADWLGKNYACHQLSKTASGRYLLFLDADEQVYNGLINSAIHRIKSKKLGLLSLFTNQVMVTVGEKMVVPLMHFVLLNLLPIRLIYIAKHYAVAAASGQFMLFDAETYHKYQWHKMAKNKVVEDVEIMKMVKSAGLYGESLLANGLITCRMYRGYWDAINGFSKNFLAAFNYSIPGFLIYLAIIIGGPIIIISTLNLPLIVFMFGLILLTKIMTSLLSGQNVIYNVALHPLQMLSMMVIAFFTVQKHLTKTNTWKNRKV
jgi:glycosyltransferase involved in cell wall biosynthesis